jgi:hypothetical protein
MAAKLTRLTHKIAIQLHQLCHLQFSLQAAGPETSGYTLVFCTNNAFTFTSVKTNLITSENMTRFRRIFFAILIHPMTMIIYYRHEPKEHILKWIGRLEILYDELHNLYASSNIIRVIKSRMMRWEVHVACIR